MKCRSKVWTMSEVRPVIGIPMERTGTPDDDITYDFFAIFRQGWPFIRVPYMPSAAARNVMGRALLENQEGFTHLVMLDIDHRHPVDVVYRLVRRVEQDPAKLVVGGLNFRRSPPHDPCVFFLAEDGYHQMAAWPQVPFRVDILGTGSIIIAKEVFERIEYPWFSRDYGTLEHPRNAGDDVTFSLKCRAAGIDLWCDPQIVSPHLGKQWITAESYVRYVQEHAIEFEPERVDAVAKIKLS